MYIVPDEHYELIKTFLKDAPTFAHSVLDFIIKGTVYADSINYNSFIIQTDSGLYYVTGNSSNECILKGIVRIFKESVKEDKRFTLFSSTNNWNKGIESKLDNQVTKIKRYAFSFDLMEYKNRRKSNVEKYDITKINSNLINYSLEFDKKYYDEYWDSKENFLQNGFGFCVKNKEKIISEGVSIFKSKDYAEIDIITDSNYKGKGLASIVAERFIDNCLTNNIEPRWDCDVDNIASIKLGGKLGFINPRNYAVYIKR